MLKKQKIKKDIPAITWVDHNDVDEWIDDLQNKWRPTSSWSAPSGNPGWSWSFLIAV